MQAVQYTAKQEMGQKEELVVRILTVTQMEFANQFVRYKHQRATELIEAHAMRVLYASEMVLVKFQVWNYKSLYDI